MPKLGSDRDGHRWAWGGRGECSMSGGDGGGEERGDGEGKIDTGDGKE